MNQYDRSIEALFGKTITYDFSPSRRPDPLGTVVFIPGFKGFKEWGPWDLVAQAFAEAGLDFLKVNLSHNGVNLSQDKYEITDLVAFSNNNFSIELDDISRTVSEVHRLRGKQARVCLIGHSRGGGLSILAASHDPRIQALVSWASPADFGNHFFAEPIAQWEREGVYTIKNNRNGEDLPIRYQLYQDFILNHDRLHIPTRTEKITQPFLAVHGDHDETVPISELGVLKDHCPHLQTHVIRGANHTFSARHPWKEDRLPEPLQEVVKTSIDFLQSRLS